MNQWWRHLTPQPKLWCISPLESLFSLDTCRIVKGHDTGGSCAESIHFQCKLEEYQYIPIIEINSVYSMAASVRQKQVGLITSECYKWCYHCNQLTVVYNKSLKVVAHNAFTKDIEWSLHWRNVSALVWNPRTRCPYFHGKQTNTLNVQFSKKWSRTFDVTSWVVWRNWLLPPKHFLSESCTMGLRVW